MTAKDLSTILLLGLLVPLSFMRPAFIDSIADELHRRRVNFAFSFGAIVAMSYAYDLVSTYLRPSGHLSLPTSRALDIAAVFLLVLAWLQHVSLLKMPSPWRQWVAKALVTAGGLVVGLWLATLELQPGAQLPYVSTLALIAVVCAIVGTGLLWCAVDPNAKASAAKGGASAAAEPDPAPPPTQPEPASQHA